MQPTQMRSLFTTAVMQADKVRFQLELDMFQPVNVFDACVSMGVTVRFVDLASIEGLYISRDKQLDPQIVVSALRPLPRRAYTCAHELGHHVFNHGNKIDALGQDNPYSRSTDSEEQMVDVFAGNFLMPIAGIFAEIAARNWNAKTLTPLQVFTLSSIFGTGYQTLIFHCKVNQIITATQEQALLKHSPSKILRTLLNTTAPSHFKIIDGQTEMPVIDLEVSNYLFLPPKTKIMGSHFQKLSDSEVGNAYIAVKPGIVQVTNEQFSSFVRIQRERYVGLVEYRHLETETP